MKVIESNNNIILKEQRDFEPAHIFDCGQCFRFNANPDGSYTGTAFGRTVRVSKEAGEIILHNTSPEDFWNIWKDYLDLDCDYGRLKMQLTSGGDPIMAEAVKYGEGIRILRQDLWETMISFIISASNNIPRIKKIIELLCANFGDAHEYEGKTYYSFPSPQRIALLTLEDLSVIRAGFRDKYILNCAKKVCSGEIDLDHIRSLDTIQAKKSLMSIYGIGNKVSDCILLFGLSRSDSFPIDVWIKRVMEYCYFGNEPQTIKTIADFADERFGELGGIAQQYLFFYAREKRIGT
ncbi:MAG: DNA-3-methyladenine glycosylase 2 family protein [Oscillospiraceae bacterium]|nr:DNA-3-methyladenine glycosylase 2 family protein [Oscillospiraceae bacterium]